MTASFAKTKLALVAMFVLLTANFLVAQSVRTNQAGPGEKLVPTGNGSAVAVPDNGAAGVHNGTVVTGNGINYNGGPVLHGNPVPIYVIWYGNWTKGRSEEQT